VVKGRRVVVLVRELWEKVTDFCSYKFKGQRLKNFLWGRGERVERCKGIVRERRKLVRPESVNENERTHGRMGRGKASHTHVTALDGTEELSPVSESFKVCDPWPSSHWSGRGKGERIYTPQTLHVDRNSVPIHASNVRSGERGLDEGTSRGGFMRQKGRPSH